MANNLKQRLGYAFGALTLLVASLPVQSINAAQITSRSITIGSSAPSASTTYTLTGTFPTTGTTIKSIQIQFCTTASGTCTASDLNAGSSTIGSITGLSGSWTNQSTANTLKITNGTGSTPTNPVTIPWSAVVNPTVANQSFYGRVTTYSDAAYTTPIDTGVVGLSTSNTINVTATVDEAITFCTGTSGITSSSCAGATGTNVNLGTLSDQTTGTGTSQIGISTNAGGGYAITYSGATLTSGAFTIDAMAAKTTSTTGVEQFGINLRSNTTPSVGVDPAGAGTTTPTADYNTSNQFRFLTGGASIASSASSDSFRLFTVSYIANVAGTTQTGTYSTSINYVATATF